MRIAIVGNFGLTGKQTMAMRALPLAEALVARGHVVRMALPARQEGDEQGPREQNGVDVSYAGRGFLPGLGYLWQVIRLALACRAARPQVLYCFKPIAYSGTILALFWVLRRLRLFRGALALDTDDWEGWGGWNERQRFPGWLKEFIARQEKWSLRHADVVTIASTGLTIPVRRAGAEKVVYVPNALASSSPDVSHAEAVDLRTSLGLGSRPVLLLYTRFVEFSLDRLLAVFERILDRRDDAVLLAVGQGLEREEEVLQQVVAERGLRDRAIIAGWPPREPLAAYFRAADVALYLLDDTLLNRTKCPVKLLELMAAGVPVVSDRVGQAAEYLEDGRTGVLVNPEDVAAMADAAVSLLGDRALRVRMGEAARSEVSSRWTWRVWALEVERALEQAAGSGQLRRS